MATENRDAKSQLRKNYQASDVSVQLNIVEVVAGGVHFPWVQLSGILHVEDCLEFTGDNTSAIHVKTP